MWDSLDVSFDSISGGQLDLRLSVTDTNGNTGNAALGALGSAGSYSFPFTNSQFVNANVDFGSVDSITFDFETIDPGVSFGISGITREAAIPEPNSIDPSGRSRNVRPCRSPPSLVATSGPEN